jgi:uncharacterized membrane protein
MKKTILFALGLIIAMFAVNAYFYAQMPDKIASHWGAQGEVNGYSDKGLGLFLLPIISAGVLLLFIIIPAIDPLRKNIQEFMKYYQGLIIVFALFMFYINLLIVYWNLGNTFNMSQLLTPALAGLFFYLGVVIGHAKKNWSIGIRTPWTMSSDVVWDKTHKLGGKLFKAGGILALLGLFFPDYSIIFVLAPVIGIAVYLFVYSFIEYRKTVKGT